MTHPPTIPFRAFGGNGSPLHIAHANSYPPGAYRQFAHQLTPHFHVTAMEQRPFWHNDPTTAPNWHTYADDLIQFFEQQGITQAVGVGHSLGGVVTMYAAVQRPDLFRAIVLIEPVIFHPNMTDMLKANPDAAKYIPLVQSALKRRDTWDTIEAVFERFRGKKVFARLSDEALWDYVRAGVRETDTGQVTLAHPKAWEAHIYSTAPSDVWEQIPEVEVPMLAIRAVQSDTLMPPTWAHWQRVQPTTTFVEIPDADHLVPLSHPQETTQEILGFLDGLS
ncbi:MAG: alpha/beta hydrolase [Methylococcales bacterium]|nr:alpha/beta hydrolase [Methylococcales bacterium]